MAPEVKIRTPELQLRDPSPSFCQEPLQPRASGKNPLACMSVSAGAGWVYDEPRIHMDYDVKRQKDLQATETQFPKAASGRADLEAIQRTAKMQAEAYDPMAARQALQRERHREVAGGDALNPLDLVQGVLSLVGMLDAVPHLAIGADSLNTTISMVRGDQTGAFLGTMSVPPGAGFGSGAAAAAYHLRHFVGLGKASPAAVELTKRLGKEVTEVSLPATGRFAKHDLTFDGSALGFGSREVHVKYADGTTGLVTEIFAFKVNKGSKIPMTNGVDSQVQRQLERIAAEEKAAHPGAVVSIRPYDNSAIPIHPSGMGGTERGWM